MLEVTLFAEPEHDYSSASRFVEIARKPMQAFHQSYFYSIFLFYGGLFSLALARINEGKEIHLQNARNNICILKRMALTCPANSVLQGSSIRSRTCSAHG